MVLNILGTTLPHFDIARQSLPAYPEQRPKEKQKKELQKKGGKKAASIDSMVSDRMCTTVLVHVKVAPALRTTSTSSQRDSA